MRVKVLKEGISQSGIAKAVGEFIEMPADWCWEHEKLGFVELEPDARRPDAVPVPDPIAPPDTKA